MRKAHGRSRSKWFPGSVLGFFAVVTVLDMWLLGSSPEQSGNVQTGNVQAENVQTGNGHNATFDFLIVSDMDENSYDADTKKWTAYLKRGRLVMKANNESTVQWGGDWGPGCLLTSEHGREGRGMELSELEIFDGHVVTGDDHTGVLYRLYTDGSECNATQWLELRGEDDTEAFKTEWMVVKDEVLMIGSHGREVTAPSDGSTIVGLERMWVKHVDSTGTVRTTNWAERYNWLREQVGAPFPGYLLHEAVLWDDVNRNWLLFPRRYSTTAYAQEENELKGWNHALVVSESFDQFIRDIEFSDLETGTARGFSTARFVPGSDNKVVLALRTVELQNSATQETFITLLDIEHGRVLLPETHVHNTKYEGLVFLPQ